MLLLVICNSINPTRALALFGESVKGNVEWGWEVPKLSKLFAKIVTKKTSITDFGIRSSWYGHDAKGHNKAMWIHHFFVMQFVHPYFPPPREWDFSTPHEHFKHREIKFLHKKWKRFIKMIDDDNVEDYESVAGVRGSPKYTLLWLGKRWSAPHPGSHFNDN
jgi:hypothetical protein